MNVLQSYMNQIYSTYESPLLPSFNVGSVCVGHVDGHYYRLQIMEHLLDESVCLAKYLDFGGYCRIQTTELKQIRTDFMSVPFQAIECLLSNIKPKGKEIISINFKIFEMIKCRTVFFILGSEWSIEAAQVVVELTQFRTLQAQIAGYSESGLPEIYLYSYISPNVRNIFN